MKKVISCLVLVCFVLCAFTACSKKEGQYSLSVGTVLTADTSDMLQSGTSAAVITDADGKIVLCRLDCAEAKAELSEGRVKETIVEKTKFELGDSYGMKKGGAMSEWFEQARFFESYVVGKTLSEVEGIKTGDDALKSGCTIDVSDFTKAIAKAINSDKKAVFSANGDLKLGLAIRASVSPEGDDAAFVHDVSAVAVCEGVSVGAVIDSAESSMTINDGKAESFIFGGTKLELGDKYGMVEHGGAKAEWYKQAKDYADTSIGKEPDKLSSLPVENVSGCTIDLDPLKAVLVRAGANVR